MDLGLGQAGSHSLRIVIYLAQEYGGGRRKAREIAEALNIPVSHLPVVLANLVRHGILTATAGPYGGYTLATPPDQLSLLQVIEATEGMIHEHTCLLDGSAGEHEDCPVHRAWECARDSLVSRLDHTSVADLVGV